MEAQTRFIKKEVEEISVIEVNLDFIHHCLRQQRKDNDEGADIDGDEDNDSTVAHEGSKKEVDVC